ncbi:DUF1217 domain-containing protein [Marivita hallyeonensis]|uniref:DUF1217 domain-containing protein n=1 Tax=Marivita hallyeonensis TaxID=996342 RepID=A0A1M5ULQ3_9RHOB|nr:DUF1217 domain-containing protein [Marivita hallyeonensis]SHH63935.1 Protein of unknown function [Marivita hallyeonensis]
MSFQPVVLGSGLGAWNFVKRTLAHQKNMHATTPSLTRDIAFFAKSHRDFFTADALTSHPQALRVVLGAYGLSEDTDHQFLIRKIMSDGTGEGALATKLSDRRYRELASDIDYSQDVAWFDRNPQLASRIIDGYRDDSFEAAIGEVDENIRLALNFDRKIGDIGLGASGTATAWFQILGTPPLRLVMEKALGLPKEFANLDIDDQHSRIRDKAKSVLGTDDVAAIASDEVRDKIIDKFILAQQVSNFGHQSSLQTALILLS